AIIKPGASCTAKKLFNETVTKRNPATSGVRVSLIVAPIPWIDNAVARRSGKLLESAAAAAGCQSAVPNPFKPHPIKTQAKTGRTPMREYPTPMESSADAKSGARWRESESAKTPQGKSIAPLISWRIELHAPT